LCCLHEHTREPTMSPDFPYTTLFRSSVGLADIDVEAHPAHQTESDVLQALVEHPDAVLLAADDVGDLGRHLVGGEGQMVLTLLEDRKSTRLNSSHVKNSYAVFCLKKK